ncbi:hypothetical protein MHW47_13510 [Streptomyces sp. OfavH-34-F]|uniref:hypothetical protein n=1 Tax=Streptomyces sp. OfavH-34-F TaxID=2917760 RepID=UPI001EF389E4|nr:hypothetical protein [Streptomyces sp. OfavH-34-F]MCG7525458.1 hypothetical protein [Streptomyces sp. OfavH-34-F]
MRISRPGRLAAGLFLGAALTLTACGEQRAGETVADSAPSPGGSASTSASASPSPPPSPSVSPGGGAQGDVAPAVPDGAPHYRENNAFKFPKKMSPASEKAARTEAGRIEPVLKRLWGAGIWDAERVRAELLELGYRDEKPDDGDGRGMLVVQDNGSTTNPGSGVALYVGRDACVTAFVQSTNYQVKVNGRFMETGCFEPRGGH